MTLLLLFLLALLVLGVGFATKLLVWAIVIALFLGVVGFLSSGRRDL